MPYYKKPPSAWVVKVQEELSREGQQSEIDKSVQCSALI